MKPLILRAVEILLAAAIPAVALFWFQPWGIGPGLFCGALVFLGISTTQGITNEIFVLGTLMAMFVFMIQGVPLGSNLYVKYLAWGITALWTGLLAINFYLPAVKFNLRQAIMAFVTALMTPIALRLYAPDFEVVGWVLYVAVALNVYKWFTYRFPVLPGQT